jgi:hypothetical protein
MKRCSKCKKEKSPEYFYKSKDRSFGLHSICIDCTKIENKKNYLKNLDHIKERNKKYRATRKDESREYHLKKLYGIRIKDYNSLFSKQGGCCAICNTHQSQLEKKLFVDHNHNNNLIRGLLCSKCNFLIGQSNDSADILRKAIRYLEQYG